MCHPHCVRSIIKSCSVYVSIYTYGHEHNNITITLQLVEIYSIQLHVSALYVDHRQVVLRTY